MTQASGAPSGDDRGDDVATRIKRDIQQQYPGAEIQFEEYADHLDVRIIPRSTAEELEMKYEGVTVTPYNALKLTIQFP